nr:ATP synthase F0 subunit 8 [Serichlamys sp. ECU1]
MPQMAPMNWPILFIMFIMTFIMFNLMNYYMYLPSNFKIKNFKNLKILSMNWKW